MYICVCFTVEWTEAKDALDSVSHSLASIKERCMSILLSNYYKINVYVHVHNVVSNTCE